jgi:hypothetical protein
MSLHRVLIACEVSGEVREAFAALYPDWEIWSADLYGPNTLLDEKPPKATHYPDGGVIWEHPDVAGSGFHYQGDVRDLFSWDHPVNRKRRYFRNKADEEYGVDIPLWDLIIAHPPCTDLSYAGARFFKEKDQDRGGDGRMQCAVSFFRCMLHGSPSPLVAVENPHSVIQDPRFKIGKATQVVQPWWFGDPYEKQIHLWLKGLPELCADMAVDPVYRVTTGGGSWRTDKAAAKKEMSRYEDSKGRHNRARMRSKTMPGFARAMAEQWGEFVKVYYCEER